ncbi:potassium-transporting ATPase subunit KdpC [Microbacterium caowuchunii]|uniref:potassium-transporting ATPase subunit KdpC n=1 Tax=Microbacterium caowuchunii TaxID=2614638 RepID=UPI001243A2DB|nr:potassium-transporting ATPase subunit KdpC [Microbacterium caowuchunii]QEV99781.1 potassium-transporting ATPase subunit KdpC [Microbacterium caowuchunii]
MTSTRTTWRTTGVALRAMLAFTLILGIGYTAAVTGIGQLLLPAQANGSVLTTTDGAVAGSALIGQSFTDADGTPLPQYFQSRPSAAGGGYDGGASGGSNWGPENDDLIAAISERRAVIADLESVDPTDIPPDAVTASGSGLDPHISPDYALLQADRVARARGVDPQTVRALVESATQSRDLGFLGEPRVNVLELNLSLDALRN